MSFKKMYGGGDAENRIMNDNYPTPPFATKALTQLIDLETRFNHFRSDVGHIVEPCCGRGWMSSELAKLKVAVVSSDLHEYENPLVENVQYGIDAFDAIKEARSTGPIGAVITNPPFKENFPQKLIEACLADEGIEVVCILQRLTFIESKRRHSMFYKYPPSIVAPFSCRFSCDEKTISTNPIGGHVSYAWYIWDRNDTSGITKMKWIDGDKAYKDWLKENSSTI